MESSRLGSGAHSVCPSVRFPAEIALVRSACVGVGYTHRNGRCANGNLCFGYHTYDKNVFLLICFLWHLPGGCAADNIT
uniref:MIP12583p n=1 Tax=Drosophila melanogaster TaxID=7227 RepID=C9QP69_DROME|nr:MIP12583p [Drosophila melanogaster]